MTPRAATPRANWAGSDDEDNRRGRRRNSKGGACVQMGPIARCKAASEDSLAGEDVILSFAGESNLFAEDEDSTGTASTSGLSSPQTSPHHRWLERDEASPAPVHGPPAHGGMNGRSSERETSSEQAAPAAHERPYLDHVVRPDDTLAGICLRYKATRRELAKLNNFSGDQFRVCAVLVVPNRAQRPRAYNSVSRGDGGPAVAALRQTVLAPLQDAHGWLSLAKLRLFARETGVSEARARHVLEHCGWDYALAKAEWEFCFGAAAVAAMTPPPADNRSSGLYSAVADGIYLPPQRPRLRHTRSWDYKGGSGGWDSSRRRGSFAWEANCLEMVDMDPENVGSSSPREPRFSDW